MSDLTPNLTAEDYRQAAHYWQTKWAATEQKLQEATTRLENASKTYENRIAELEEQLKDMGDFQPNELPR